MYQDLRWNLHTITAAVININFLKNFVHWLFHTFLTACILVHSWQYCHNTLLMIFCLGPLQFACPGPRRWFDQTESKLWNKFAINLHTAHQHALLLAMTKEDQACAMRLFMFVPSLLSISASNVYCCGQNKNYHNVNFCSLLSWGPRHDSWLDAFHSWV